MASAVKLAKRFAANQLKLGIDISALIGIRNL